MRPILLTSIIALLLSQPLSALASSKPADPAKEAHPAAAVTAAAAADTEQALAAQDAWQALALGREVYKDLLRARRAAAKHNEIDTRMALHDASRILDSFYEPAVVRALRQQVGIIREDLAREGMKPEAGLWLPLEAELSDVLLAAPPQHQKRAMNAAQEGHSAAARGDRDTAKARLNVLEEVLDYRWGLLPLDRIRGDVHSAELSMDPRPPYWKGIEVAVQSALDAVQWVTTTDATGWFSAYEETVHARLELPEHPKLAKAALARAGKDLDGLKNATALAGKAHTLAAQPQPELKAVESLLKDLRAGINP